MPILSCKLIFNKRYSCYVHGSSKSFANHSDGFSLVEVLVALVVITVASAGAIGAFNLIRQSIRGTEARSDQNRLIDENIAQITRISATFTSCITPTGANPVDPESHCTGTDVAFGNSYYYFPVISDRLDPSTWTNATNFRTACNAGTLRSNFIAALGGGSAVSLNASDGSPLVTRQPIVAVANSKHLVEITWTAPGDASRVFRKIRVAPIVSAWCP